jgi:hypothetical protein
MEDLDEITLDKQTLIHIAGMPFWLPEGAVIHGRKANYELALKDIQARKEAILNIDKVEQSIVCAQVGGVSGI